MAARKHKPWQERFWQKVYKDDVSGCWFWTRAHSKGYGVLQLNGQAAKATRLSLQIHGIEIPTGLQVLHRCDCPPCVNPDHLFFGTHLDNIADKMAKGRHRGPRGERAAIHILTSEKVQALRTDYATSNDSMRALAKKYRVCHQTVQLILSKNNWKHLPWPNEKVRQMARAKADGWLKSRNRL